MNTHPALHKFLRFIERFYLILLVIFLVLLAFRIALPHLVETYVNHQLNKTKNFTGSVGDITIHLWRGGYRIHNVQIMKRDGSVKSPLFSAKQIDLAVDWRELFHGSLKAQVVMLQPRANFVEGPTPQQSQTGKDEAWNQILTSLFPFDINRFEIDDGEIHFQNPQSKPPVDIYTSHISAVATNLTNAREIQGKLPSGLQATATSIGGGQLNLNLHMNVIKPQPAYEVDFTMTNIDLPALNDFLRAYGKFDVASGKFALYVSVAADEGSYKGYSKVFFKNLSIFEWDKERKKKCPGIILAGHRCRGGRGHRKSSQRSACREGSHLRNVHRHLGRNLEHHRLPAPKRLHPRAHPNTGPARYGSTSGPHQGRELRHQWAAIERRHQ